MLPRIVVVCGLALMTGLPAKAGDWTQVIRQEQESCDLSATTGASLIYLRIKGKSQSEATGIVMSRYPAMDPTWLTALADRIYTRDILFVPEATELEAEKFYREEYLACLDWYN